MNKIISTITIISILFGTGCSAFRTSTEKINVNCAPPDSILVVNGTRYNSPAQINARRDRNLSIQCSKKGYSVSQRTIGHHFNGTGALDVAGTLLFLVPAIGLFTSGAWSLDETDINIQLYEK